MSSTVTFKPPEADIVYSPSQITVPQIIQAIENIDNHTKLGAYVK